MNLDLENESLDRSTQKSCLQFKDMDLDYRLLKAIQDLNFSNPTLIQETAIPLALQGKDILAKAKTGSGKTMAYLLPILQKIILNSDSKSIILVPTKELANQVFQVSEQLLKYFTLDSKITVLNFSQFTESVSDSEVEDAHILLGTPSRIKSILSKIDLQNFTSLAIDEADLITCFGYYKDLQDILEKLPKIYQTWLMSATLAPDVMELKKLVLKNPAVIQLQEEESNITQFMIKTSELDKFLILYFLLKLRVSPIGNGKILVFVNSIERCYKLKLFLEQFGIKACTLNSELPAGSRFHIVQEFNRGIYDFLIATDESNETGNKVDSKDLEYGVYRGIDFKNVKSVINFDLPKSSKSYAHRIGRTGRGNDKGYSLTFYVQGSPVINSKKDSKKLLQDKVFSKIQKIQKENGNKISEFKFDMTQVDAFRYRIEDALRAVTGANVRDAHLKDIKHEILNSEKLKSHFENRPKDLEALRHDKFIHPSRIQHQLKHIPDYLLPKRSSMEYSGFVPFSKNKRPEYRKKGSLKRKRDPLKNF